MITRLDLIDLNYLNICFNFVMMGYWLICEPSGMKIDIIRTSLEKIPEKYISFHFISYGFEFGFAVLLIPISALRFIRVNSVVLPLSKDVNKGSCKQRNAAWEFLNKTDAFIQTKTVDLSSHTT